MSLDRWHALAMLFDVVLVFALVAASWNARRKNLPAATGARYQIAALSLIAVGLALHRPPAEIAGDGVRLLELALAFALGLSVGALSAALPKSINSEQ